jgi:cob(I)alamin adenosyltransferase
MVDARDPGQVPVTAPPRAVRRAPSLVLVATGDGKGKTTAAMGTVVRALARGWRVCVVQFIKSGSWHTGEIKVLSGLGATWHSLGDGFTWDSDDLERSAELARAAWEVAADAISSGEFQLVVLDEVTYPLNWGWLDSDAFVAAIAGRAERTNVFITGRNASEAIVAVADTVTEMRNVKHAFEAGIRAAKGIDF